MSLAREYLAIPEEYGAWLGLRWSAQGDAVEHVAADPEIGLTFAIGPEIAAFLEGLHSVRSPIHFAYVIHLLKLLAIGPKRYRFEPCNYHLLARLSTAYLETGRPVRNAGALCGVLCRDIPRAIDPPDIVDLGIYLRGGPSLSRPAGLSELEARGEMPSLEPKEFEERVHKELFALDDESLLHWLRHGRGTLSPAGERIAEEALAARPKSFLEILDEAGHRPRLAQAQSMVAHLAGALNLPPRRLSLHELPAGGYSDVTTRGQPDQILPSQFALDDLEFLRRFAARELLYYHREQPWEASDEELVLVLDQGVRTWGEVRLALSAAALALARRAAAREIGLRLTTTSHGEVPCRPSESAPNELGILLEASDFTREPSEALRRALDDPAGATWRDIVLLTHPRNLTEDALRSAARELPPGTRLFAVAVDEDGGLELSEMRHGRPVPIGRSRVRIPREASAPRATTKPERTPWRGDVEAIGFPFRLGIAYPLDQVKFAFEHAGEWLLALSSGPIMLLYLWKLDVTTEEILPRPMLDGRPFGDVEAVIGVARGFVIVGRRGKDVALAHYDLLERSCTVTVLDASLWSNRLNSPAHREWVYGRDLHSIVALDIDDDGTRAVAFDLGAHEERSSHRRGSLSVTRTTREVVAASRARGYEPDRLMIMTEGAPLPPTRNAIRLDSSDGLVGVRIGGIWAQFTPLSDGRPALRGGRILQARSGGDTLAILAEGASGHRAIHIFAFPTGRSLGKFHVGRTESEFALTRDGRRIARRTGRSALSVNTVGGAGLPQFSTSPGKIHSRLTVGLGPDCLTIQSGKSTHFLKWDRGVLDHQYGESSPAPLRNLRDWAWLSPNHLFARRLYDPWRFVNSSTSGNLTAVQDILGQVAILDIKGDLIAMFHAFRETLAGWLPDGTAFGPATRIGGADSPYALQRIGQALCMASVGLPMASARGRSEP